MQSQFLRSFTVIAEGLQWKSLCVTKKETITEPFFTIVVFTINYLHRYWKLTGENTSRPILVVVVSPLNRSVWNRVLHLPGRQCRSVPMNAASVWSMHGLIKV